MRVETVPVYGDNYAYLVICEESGQAAAVDPADADAVARRAGELEVRIAAIWCTHHHGDHTGGNQVLARETGCRVFGHGVDSERIPALTDTLEHGATVRLGGLEARVLHTPGHTRGSICYLVEDCLFTGDTLFACGCGRLFEGDAPTMFGSLHERIRPLPASTRIHCGHEYTLKNLDFAWTVEPGNPALGRRADAVRELRSAGRPSVPFTLAEELSTNPFLRCESPEIVASLGGRHGLTAGDPLSVFTRLRELRNSY
jgi:hydroxyacylglutathione hydrolase